MRISQATGSLIFHPIRALASSVLCCSCQPIPCSLVSSSVKFALSSHSCLFASKNKIYAPTITLVWFIYVEFTYTCLHSRESAIKPVAINLAVCVSLSLHQMLASSLHDTALSAVCVSPRLHLPLILTSLIPTPFSFPLSVSLHSRPLVSLMRRATE